MVEKWIIPCNLKYFNIEEHFLKTETVMWKNSFTIKNDDIVYIYLSAPVSAIRYRCRVISDQVSDKEIKNNQYAVPQKESHNYYSKKTKFIIMQLEQEYPKGLLTLETLRKQGLGQVQIQARADRALSQYLTEIDKMIQIKPKNGGEDNA